MVKWLAGVSETCVSSIPVIFAVLCFASSLRWHTHRPPDMWLDLGRSSGLRDSWVFSRSYMVFPPQDPPAHLFQLITWATFSLSTISHLVLGLAHFGVFGSAHTQWEEWVEGHKSQPAELPGPSLTLPASATSAFPLLALGGPVTISTRVSTQLWWANTRLAHIRDPHSQCGGDFFQPLTPQDGNGNLHK